MTNEFDEVMAQRTDAELMTILNSPEGDYQPAAIEAAKRVFQSRNLSEKQVVAVKAEIKQKQFEDDIKANEPLGLPYKILTCIFPGIIQIIYSGTFYANGYDRKSKELRLWTLYGYAFYWGIAILIVLIEFVF